MKREIFKDDENAATDLEKGDMVGLNEEETIFEFGGGKDAAAETGIADLEVEEKDESELTLSERMARQQAADSAERAAEQLAREQAKEAEEQRVRDEEAAKIAAEKAKKRTQTASIFSEAGNKVEREKIEKVKAAKKAIEDKKRAEEEAAAKIIQDEIDRKEMEEFEKYAPLAVCALLAPLTKSFFRSQVRGRAGAHQGGGGQEEEGGEARQGEGAAGEEGGEGQGGEGEEAGGAGPGGGLRQGGGRETGSQLRTFNKENNVSFFGKRLPLPIHSLPAPPAPPHSPVYTGLLFSLNAFSPSIRSFVGIVCA
jgi:hypothetical protein